VRSPKGKGAGNELRKKSTEFSNLTGQTGAGEELGEKKKLKRNKGGGTLLLTRVIKGMLRGRGAKT